MFDIKKNCLKCKHDYHLRDETIQDNKLCLPCEVEILLDVDGVERERQTGIVTFKVDCKCNKILLHNNDLKFISKNVWKIEKPCDCGENIFKFKFVI
jgi:hypothetical protein